MSIHAGRIDSHRACVHCGYDLFGHETDGNCSECGRTVKLTLRFDRRKPSDRWLPGVFDGLAVGLCCLGMLLAVFLGTDPAGPMRPVAQLVLCCTPLIALGMMGYATHRADQTAMIRWHVTALIMILMVVAGGFNSEAQRRVSR